MLVSVLQKLGPIRELILFDQLLINVPTDLTKELTFQELLLRAALAVKYAQIGAAYKLLKRLQIELFKQNQETKDHYEPVMVWLQYAAMPDLAPGELVDFFKHYNFTIILNDEDFNDLVGILRLRLSLEDINDRDGWREKIYNALHENEKLITEFSGASGRKTTVANWLKLYDTAIGLEPAESIAVAEFNSQNAIVFKLDEGGKALWKRLVDFYEYLKLSSSDPLGFEEDVIIMANGNNYLLSNGEQVDLARVESELKPVAPKLTAPPVVAVISEVSLPPLSNIIKQAQSYLLATAGEIPKVILELQKSVGSGNILGVTGALLLLAQLRRLDDVLSDDLSFRAMVAADLDASGQTMQKEGLNINPTSPNYIARFLKIVLQDKLGLPERDALLFAARIAGLMALEGEKYGRIVIPDAAGKLKWNL